MHPEARHQGPRVSRISLKTTRAFTCGSRKDWEVGIPFLFVRDGLWSRTKFQTSTLLPRSSTFPCPLTRPAKHERAHTDLSFLCRLKPFPRFYILDEIPVALSQFITFANQMMSLDILRRGFIAVFYAGRTAPVKRIRAEHSRLIGYHDEIHSSSRSCFSNRRSYGFFFSSSHGHVRTSYTFLPPLFG